MKCALYDDTLSFIPNDIIPQNWEEVYIGDYSDYTELANGYNSRKYILGEKLVEGKLMKCLVLNPNYEEEQAEIREENFKNEFFEIENYGWYRKKPKGYTSALESLTVAYNMVTSGVIQELPAGTFIFYPEPDYTIPEQCTEEWLVEHHILSEAMTAQQFLPFYAQFVVAWNNEMHKASLIQEVE